MVQTKDGGKGSHLEGKKTNLVVGYHLGPKIDMAGMWDAKIGSAQQIEWPEKSEMAELRVGQIPKPNNLVILGIADWAE